MLDKTSIRQNYIEFVLENSKKPASIFSFSKLLEISESDFYSFYASFEAIEKDIWKSIFVEVLEQLEADETYQKYAAKDKLLAFYFMWVQKLRNNRSFIMLQVNPKLKSIPLNALGLDELKNAFIKYAEQLIDEGVDNKEIKERKYLTDKYAKGFWLQTLFVLNYWINDNSENFEMTDAAIEKAVNLCFKLISDNALDSVIDFGKFVIQKTA
jgi:hypothetical protein